VSTHHAPSHSEASSQSSDPVGRKGKIGVRVVGRPDSLEQRVYLPEVIRGLGVTAKHFFANLFSRKYTVTVEYPEQKLKYPERNRGLHRLMLRDDGHVRCVACMLCPTVCPAHCITIVPEETGNKTKSGRASSRSTSFAVSSVVCASRPVRVTPFAWTRAYTRRRSITVATRFRPRSTCSSVAPSRWQRRAASAQTGARSSPPSSSTTLPSSRPCSDPARSSRNLPSPTSSWSRTWRRTSQRREPAVVQSTTCFRWSSVPPS
jgi:ferredoxin